MGSDDQGASSVGWHPRLFGLSPCGTRIPRSRGRESAPFHRVGIAHSISAESPRRLRVWRGKQGPHSGRVGALRRPRPRSSGRNPPRPPLHSRPRVPRCAAGRGAGRPGGPSLPERGRLGRSQRPTFRRVLRGLRFFAAQRSREGRRREWARRFPDPVRRFSGRSAMFWIESVVFLVWFGIVLVQSAIFLVWFAVFLIQSVVFLVWFAVFLVQSVVSLVWFAIFLV
jgi:hypothetical protein